MSFCFYIPVCSSIELITSNGSLFSLGFRSLNMRLDHFLHFLSMLS